MEYLQLIRMCFVRTKPPYLAVSPRGAKRSTRTDSAMFGDVGWTRVIRKQVSQHQF